MKVLQINAVNGLGSTGRNVSELASELERRGVQSRVAHSTGVARDNGFVIGTDFEKSLHALSSRIWGRQAHYSRIGTRRLLEYIAVESPDVVHLHNVHSNYLHLPMLLEFLAQADIATVVTLHDCWFFTGKCCHYTLDACTRWETGCGSCPSLAKDNPSWFFDRTALMWQEKKRLFESIPRLAVIGVSDWITSEAERSFLSCASIIRRIYNWIDLSVFEPVDPSGIRRRFGLADRFVVLGVASTWSDAKGLTDFLRLDQMLRKAHPLGQATGVSGEHLDIATVLVGGIGSGITLPGSITRIDATSDMEELAAVYSAADVLLQLSCEESFGKVVAESLACDTPAIVYDSTANAELVGSGCGYVVEPRDLEELARRVRDLMSGVQVHQGGVCRDFAKRNFALVDRASDHVELYEQLCALGRRR